MKKQLVLTNLGAVEWLTSPVVLVRRGSCVDLICPQMKKD